MRFRLPIRAALLALLAGCLAPSAGVRAQDGAQAPTTIRIAYLTQEVERPPALSNLDEPPPDEGLAGARQAIADNDTTGRFLKQRFELDAVTVPPDGDPAAALRELAGKGHRIVVLDLPGETAGALARLPEASGLLLFNAGSSDDSLRAGLCAPNLLHTMPSRSMLADALAQYLVRKRWTKWFLITGQRPEDALYAAAVKRAAKRFGAEVVEEKAWTGEHDARRTAQAEIPVFTQAKRYDVLMVADEVGEFGDYLMYRTWDPRPVAGTQGLVPTSWHRAHEAWGAAQLQSRFARSFHRIMLPRDHAVWTAVRAVGEAATRTRSGDTAKLADFVKGPDFTLAAFKGVPLSFRPWDGQLRQPVLLAAERSLVSVSPQDGFLHPKTELDTLGYDQPETGCRQR